MPSDVVPDGLDVDRGVGAQVWAGLASIPPACRVLAPSVVFSIAESKSIVAMDDLGPDVFSFSMIDCYCGLLALSALSVTGDALLLVQAPGLLLI